MARTNRSDDRHEHLSSITPSQALAIKALLAGDSFRDAALKAGVDERTLRRWRTHDTEFEAALRRSTEDLRQDLSIRIVAGAQKALETLLTIASDPTHPRALPAACHVLTLAKVSCSEDHRASREQVAMDQLIRCT